MDTIDNIIKLLEEDGVPEHKWASTLADITDQSPQATARWISKKVKNIKYKNLQKIATHFEVSVEELSSEKEEPNKKNRTRLDDLVAKCRSEGIQEIAADQLENLLKAALIKK